MRLDSTVAGFHATMRSKSFPGSAVPNYSHAPVVFKFVRRGTLDEPVVFPVKSSWPTLYVDFAGYPGRLVSGYYEGWFEIGCLRVCKALFMVSSQLCFDLCPVTEPSGPVCPPCTPDTPDCCAPTLESKPLVPQYKTYPDGITVVFDQACIPKGCAG